MRMKGGTTSPSQEKKTLTTKNLDIEQLLEIMENYVDALMKDAISITKKSEDVFWVSSKMMYQLPLEPSRQEAFEDLVLNFILDQEERVKKLEEYMEEIGSDFM
ncbi:hypothetical protein Tco_0505340 [Tanacetum coccineum]